MSATHTVPLITSDSVPTAAPVVLFVFARPDHTRRTLEALAANTLATETDLFVYADAARNTVEAERVNAVRQLVRQASGFRSVTVIERESNYGLARNIIDGVTDVINRYGRAIVLEDDLIASPCFLQFMNSALGYYEHCPDVMHISGWTDSYPLIHKRDTFLWRFMNCWGWATWATRWEKLILDNEEIYNRMSPRQISQFTYHGLLKDAWQRFLLNRSGKLKTWAIYWNLSIFLNGGLCVNPVQSYVHNIGLDGSGENCPDSGPVRTGKLNRNCQPHFDEQPRQRPLIKAQLMAAMVWNQSLLYRIYKRIRNLYAS